MRSWTFGPDGRGVIYYLIQVRDRLVDLLDVLWADRTGRAATGTRDGLVADLVERLVAYLTAHAPPGRLAESRGADAVLATATDAPSARSSSSWPARSDTVRWVDMDPVTNAEASLTAHRDGDTGPLHTMLDRLVDRSDTDPARRRRAAQRRRGDRPNGR